MIRLRPFKDSDASYLIQWMEDESSFVKWCANNFQYPLTLEQVVSYKKNHDSKTDSWIFTAIDDTGLPVGHVLFCRFNLEKNSVHLGHVIVDTKKRKNGLGNEMIKKAVEYGFDILGVSKITLSVFDNNPGALQCYRHVGFEIYETYKEAYTYHNEKWGVHNMQILR